MTDIHEYLKIQRRMWIAVHYSMCENLCFDKSKINKIMHDADIYYWQLEKKEYKDQLCWLCNTYNDYGMFEDKWATDKPEKVIKLKVMTQKIKSFKKKMCRLLSMESDNSTFNDIVTKTRELKNKKRGIYIVKK